MDSVITAQAMAYLANTLGDNAAGIRITGIDTGGPGPLVRWEIPRLSRPRVSDRGEIYRHGVTDLLSRMIALRWAGGQEHRDPPPESYLDLHSDYPAVFTQSLETPAGWHWMLEAAAEAILEQGAPTGHMTCQVKEKFGTLRWYARGSTTEQVLGVMTSAEWLSGAVCEHCGAPGSVRPDGWIRTLCDAHADRKSRR